MRQPLQTPRRGPRSTRPTHQALKRRPGAFQLSLWDIPAPSFIPAVINADSTTLAPVKPAAGANPFPATRPRASEAAESFARAYRRLRPAHPEPAMQVAFRHFTGLRSAIRIKGRNVIEARLSDLLQDAPPLVIDALAEILISRLFRKRTSREASECYKAWAASPAVAHRIEEIRRTRGRKRLVHPEGNHFDLRTIFEDVNARFFGGRIQVAGIGWSPNRSRRMLGHYDSSHQTITVTRWLDGRRVPRYVVEYLVYHEMLHAEFPVEHRNHRRVVHSKAFRAAERRFPDYERAARWLKGGWRTKGAKVKADSEVMGSSF